MSFRYILLACLFGIMSACHKDHSTAPPPKPVNVKLKDMSIQALPAPYYHFEYDGSGTITRAGISGNMKIYDVSYRDKKIVSICVVNGPEKDTLRYEYYNGELVTIKIADPAGVVYRRCFPTFGPGLQLLELEWEVKNPVTGFDQEKTLRFTYYPDGNLKELNNTLYAVGSQKAGSYTDKFENYDNKTNVDGFSLIHFTQSEHLLLFPGSRFQVNNALKLTRTGSLINYAIDYTYTYDDKNRPTIKNGDVLWTSGPDAGKHFTSTTTYSYYD